MKNFNFATLFLAGTICFFFSACDSGAEHPAYGNGEEERDTLQKSTGRDFSQLQEFARKAFSVGKMEVSLSQVVIEKTDNQGLKQLARKIKEDHRKANQELKGIVNKYGWNIEKGMTEEEERKVEELNNASEEDQNHRYLQMMVQSHQRTINEFEQVLRMEGEQETSSIRREERLNLDSEEEDPERRQDTAAASPQRDSPPAMTEETTEDRENGQGETHGHGEETEGGGHSNLRKHNTYDDRATGVEQGERDKAKAKYAENVGAPELMRWVRTTLPKLREHLEQSRKMQEQIPRKEQ